MHLYLVKYGRLPGEMTKREGGGRWIRKREKPGKNGRVGSSARRYSMCLHESERIVIRVKVKVGRVKKSSPPRTPSAEHLA